MEIRVLPEDLNSLKRLNTAIQIQEDILASLHQSVSRVIQDRYGVDLEREQWTLDLDRGVLENDSTA